jgi:serine O-acetyltransferase
MNAIKLYRLSHKLYLMKIPIIPKILKNLIFLLFNSIIPYTAEIGEESKFGYGGIGVVIHSKAKIGKRVLIGQGVTIGRSLDPMGVPTIGNNVYISAGAKIIGDIKIGDNVIIGANSVVNKDIPSNSICAGVPCKVIRTVNDDIYCLLKDVYNV